MRRIIGFLIIVSGVFTTASGQSKDSLAAVFNMAPADTPQIKAALGLSNLYLNTNPDSAIFWSGKAISLSTSKKQFKSYRTSAFNSSGMAHYYAGKYPQAIVAFQGYYDAAKEEGDLIKMGFAKNNQGNVYIELGKYDSTLILYNQALEIRKKSKDAFSIAQSYVNIGYVQKEMGNYDEAIQSMLIALKEFEKLKDQKAVATTYNYLGQIHIKKGEPAKSRELFTNALHIFQSLKDEGNIAISYHSLGNVWLQEKQTDSARLYFEKAKTIYTSQNDTRQLALLNAIIANSYAQDGMFAKSFPYFQLAISQNRTIGNDRSVAGIYLAYAEARINNKETSMAKFLLDTAWMYTKGSNKITDIRDYYKIEALYFETTGNAKAGLNSMHKYLVYNDSVLNETNIKAIADMEAKYETEKKEKEITIQKAAIGKRNSIITGISLLSVLLLLLGFSYYKRYQLKKEKELQAEVLHQQEIATKAILQAEETERRRIAAELHDGVGQLMSAARMNLEAVVNELKPLENEKMVKLDRVISLVDEGCREVRAVSHSMMPNALLKKGLGSALQDFIQKIDQKVLKTQLHIEGLQETMNPEVESVLYRVIQECVNNVIKHSQATQIDIAVLNDAAGINISIEDNGVGFDPSKTTEGIGLQNMRARIKYLKGTLEIDSAPGRGTFTGIYIPIESV